MPTTPRPGGWTRHLGGHSAGCGNFRVRCAAAGRGADMGSWLPIHTRSGERSVVVHSRAYPFSLESQRAADGLGRGCILCEPLSSGCVNSARSSGVAPIGHFPGAARYLRLLAFVTHPIPQTRHRTHQTDRATLSTPQIVRSGTPTWHSQACVDPVSCFLSGCVRETGFPLARAVFAGRPRTGRREIDGARAQPRVGPQGLGFSQRGRDAGGPAVGEARKPSARACCSWPKHVQDEPYGFYTVEDCWLLTCV